MYERTYRLQCVSVYVCMDVCMYDSTYLCIGSIVDSYGLRRRCRQIWSVAEIWNALYRHHNKPLKYRYEITK